MISLRMYSVKVLDSRMNGPFRLLKGGQLYRIGKIKDRSSEHCTERYTDFYFLKSVKNRAERNGLKSRLWLFFSPFFIPPKKRGKKKRRMNIKNRDFKSYLSARSCEGMILSTTQGNKWWGMKRPKAFWNVGTKIGRH